MAAKIFFILLFTLLILAPNDALAYPDYLADITVSQPTPSALPLHWNIEVACDWQWGGVAGKEDEAEIRITAIPLTNGVLSPGAYYEGVGPYGPGSGRIWPTFTIQSGETIVDEILLTMEVVGQHVMETILEVRIPVWLHFGPHAFQALDFNFESPERMQFGQFVNVDFTWRTNHVGGHRVVIRPLTNGSYTPNMEVGGSPVLTGTSGSVNRYFTLREGGPETHVDGVVFEIYNEDWSELLYAFERPADYTFGTTAIQNIVMTPDSPASLIHMENVTITFDYLTDYPADPMVLAYPQTDGSNTPNFLLNMPAPLPPVSGSGECTFTVFSVSGLQDVDEVLFVMYDYFNQENIIDQFRVPVYYHFSGHSIRNVEYDPKPPAVLTNNTQVSLYITYENSLPDPGYLYNTLLSWGTPVANTDGYFRSIANPGMNPPKRHFFTVTEGEAQVDRMLFEMFNAAEDELWLSFRPMVWFHYGPSAALVPVIEVPGAVPVLHNCYPNPFNPATTIRFELPADMVAGLSIYDLKGRLVKALVGRQAMAAGEKKIRWDGTDRTGRPAAAGVYLYRLEADRFNATKLMTLVK